MGCDIHAYIDMNAAWSRKGERPYPDHFGHIRLDRNYELFGLLAGVRGNLPPVVEPRGLPPTQRQAEEQNLPLDTPLVSGWTEGDYGLYVSKKRPEPKEGEELEPEPYEQGMCSWEDAEKWTSSGFSETILRLPRQTGGELWRISNPDWHTPSYLFIEELEAVQQRYLAHAREHRWPGGYSQPLNAAIAAMKGLGSKSRPRLVFWFDN